jgi:hypothetical protein
MQCTVYEASGKAQTYARTLAAERVIGEPGPYRWETEVREILARIQNGGRVSGPECSRVIDWLKTLPEAAAAAALVPGIYQVGDDVYKVQRSRQSGRLYAQKHTGAGFDYDAGRGMIGVLRPEHLMTTVQARVFGQRFGMCVNGHPLSDRTSRYFGYGETCANNNGWTYDPHLVPADFE